jgi:hypothetical protein
MRQASVVSEQKPRVLPHAPEELTVGRLRRIGEGVGKVVYASEHWVVKRDRSPSEIVALIVLWKILKKLERVLPQAVTAPLLQRPSRKLRVLRIAVQSAIGILPKSVWFSRHVRELWTVYHRRSVRGERLAQKHLSETELMPESVTFPPVRVRVAGWPGSLIVSEATERVEATLHDRLRELARAGRFEELEDWLSRFLEVRQSGWRCGVFSVDAHLKNFGVTGDRIVLLDTGGLTNRWSDIEERLAFEEVVAQPHIQLGLGPLLGGRPDIANRFDTRWKATVNREVVGGHWQGRQELS